MLYSCICVVCFLTCNILHLGQTLEKVGGKEFQQEVKDVLASNGPLEVAAGTVICKIVLSYQRIPLFNIVFEQGCFFYVIQI